MTLARMLRALNHFMPSSGRWALLSEEASLLYHTPSWVTDRQDFGKVLQELLPYLEILSGDILLVQGAPLLSHDGEAALVMTFPKSVAGQNLFFIERITLNPFGNLQGRTFPPLFLSRDFADEGDLLSELQDVLPRQSLDILTSSFHHLLWTQLKVLDLFSEGTLKKIKVSDVRNFFRQHVEGLAPYFDSLMNQTLVLEKPWAPERSIHIQVEKKNHLLAFDFSKSQWPKEWGVGEDLLSSLLPQVVRHHLYPGLIATQAEQEFFGLTVAPSQVSQGPDPLWPVVTAPVLCDLLSEALLPLFGESQGSSSSCGPLYFELDFGDGLNFRHMLFGGGGASSFSHGELGHNPWLPGLDTLSFQKSLAPLPLKILKLGRRHDSGGQGLSLGGDGTEWILNLNRPAELTAYTFQSLWPAKGIKAQNTGKKAQILVQSGNAEGDILGRKIQIKQMLPKGTTLTLRTAGGAGLDPS